MLQIEKELVVHRIIAGFFKVELELGISLLLKQPDRLQRYMAEEVYLDVLRKAELNGSYTHEQYMELLFSKGLWNNDKQKLLDGLPKDLEELKLELFQSAFQSQKRQTIRKAIALNRAEFAKLNSALHEYDYLTSEGLAHMSKARYIIATSLYRIDNTKLYKDDELWNVPDNVIEDVANAVSTKKLTENKVRELSRTEPWRTIWIGRKSETSLFGVPAVDLTDEQRMLVIWSGVYDSVYEHPECPGEEVIEDDDMLDGWMIFQKRKREAERGENKIDSVLTNDKIKNSEEIFIPVDNARDAAKVNALNDAASAAIQRQRMRTVQQRGVVNEQEMPDAQLKIRTKLTEMYKNHVQGKG